MTFTVMNTHHDGPVMTLFRWIHNDACTAQKMHQDEVSYARYWKKAFDPAMVLIVLKDARLCTISQSRDERKLDCDTLQDYRSAADGTSTLVLSSASTFVQWK